jgi:hypothetical protein
MHVLLAIVIVVLAALSTAQTTQYLTPSPVSEKIRHATADSNYLYVITESDPPRIIKFKQGTMERLTTYTFALSQKVSFTSLASTDAQQKYLYVYGYYYSQPNYNVSNGTSVLVRMLIQNGEFSLDWIQSVPIVGDVQSIFADESYIYYVTKYSAIRSPLNDLEKQDSITAGEKYMTMGDDPDHPTHKIAYFTNVNIQLKTFESRPQHGQFLAGNYTYTVYNETNQYYVKQTDIHSQSTRRITVGPPQDWNIYNYHMSFIADSVNQTVYVMYRQRAIYGAKYYRPPWENIVVYRIDNSMENATMLVTLTDTDAAPDLNLPVSQFLFALRGHLYYKSNGNDLYQFSLTAPYDQLKVSLTPTSIGDCQRYIARQYNLYCVSKYGLKRYEYCTGTVYNIYNVYISPFHAKVVHVDTNEKFAYIPTQTRIIVTIDLASNTSTSGDWLFADNTQLGSFTLDSAYQFFAVGNRNEEFRAHSIANTTLSFSTGYNLQQAAITTTSDAIYFAHPLETTTVIAKWCQSCGYRKLFTVSGSDKLGTSIAVQGEILYLAQSMKLSTHSLATSKSITSVISDAPIMYPSGSAMYFPGGEYMYWVTPMSETIQKVHVSSLSIVETIQATRARTYASSMRPDGTIYFGGVDAYETSRISSNLGVIGYGKPNVCRPAKIPSSGTVPIMHLTVIALLVGVVINL